MRLLFLNYECPPAGGGAGFATLALAREMAGRGHEIDVLTARPMSAPARQVVDGVLLRRVRSYRRSVHQVGMGGVLTYLACAARELPRLAQERRYDAYHYYFGAPTGLLSLVPGPHQRRPYLLSLRGSDVPGYDPHLDPWHRLMWPLTRRVWSRAAGIVANSAGLRDIALRTSPRSRIDVIRNGVVPSPAGTPDSGRPIRVLTTSRLIERKRVDTLLRAIAELDTPRIALDIAGDGPCMPALQRLTVQLGIADRVVFHGFQDQRQLAVLRARADAFVLASSSESCSMAVLEAIGAGLPVVASRVGGTPELVRAEQNGLLFEVGDAPGLAGALRRLCTEPGLHARLSAGSQRLAQNEFSWSSVAARYETLFAAAIREAP
jgi:glycosyltransferase involved in cell wall biosynthesis